MRTSWVLAGAFASTIASAALAQDASKKLTLDALFQSPSISGPSLRGLQLSPDGKLVTLLKPRPDEANRFDLWAIDTTTGAERMLVDACKPVASLIILTISSSKPLPRKVTTGMPQCMM